MFFWAFPSVSEIHLLSKMLPERHSKIWQIPSKILSIIRFYHFNFYLFILKIWNDYMFQKFHRQQVHVPFPQFPLRIHYIYQWYKWYQWYNGTKSGNLYWYTACVIWRHFISCADSQNYHYNQDTELLHQHSDLLPVTTYSHMHPSLLPPSTALATSNRRSSICIILSFLKCYLNGIIPEGSFEISVLHSTCIFAIHPSCCV